jgi:hypothetical protein
MVPEKGAKEKITFYRAPLRRVKASSRALMSFAEI